MRNNKGQFTSEGLKGNQFAKGNAPNSTSFKRGRTPHNYKGFPRILYNKGKAEVICTIDKTKLATSRGRQYEVRMRTSYARVCFGLNRIPKGMVVYHLDRDVRNNKLSNLELITRAELLRRNRQ